MRAAVALLVALAPMAAVWAQSRDLRWVAGGTTAQPLLAFAAASGAGEVLRLSCAGDGTRVVVFTRGTPRGLAPDAENFQTRVNLFLGRTEYSLGGVGTPLADGTSRVDALLPDVPGFFAALAGQGRLVAVTFAGRTTAPAPDAGLVDGFRTACAALG